MCAEKDPIDCHRSLLITRALEHVSQLNLYHITHEGELESQKDLNDRLIQHHQLHDDLFCSENDKIQLAYQAQNKLKAYKKPV